jgi:chromosome segregation ATPase
LIYAWCWFEGKPTQVDVAVGCLIPNTPEWRAKYEQIVASATKWADTLKILEITDDPNATPTDKIKSILAGYKSRETDLSNKLNDKQGLLDNANKEIGNRTEQVSRLEGDLLEKDKYYKSLVDALNKQIKNGSDALPLAQARVGVLEGELDEANKAKGRALLDAQQNKSQLEACQKGSITPTPQLILKMTIQYITSLITKKGGENHG